MLFDFTQDIILENNRALLQPMQATDLPNLLPVATSDVNLLQYSPTPIYNEALLRAYIEAGCAERKNNIRYPFIILDKVTATYAGSTSFAAISNKDKRLEIGWTWLGATFQKTGLNRNCKYLMLSYAFDYLQFERVELKTDERNAKSRAAIEKIGGQFEGILRSHTVLADGYRRNTVYYSILKKEWEELKSHFLR